MHIQNSKMSKQKIKFPAYCMVFVCLFINAGCKKDNSPASTPIPFQGPQNPSFESVNSNWVLVKNGTGTIAYDSAKNGFMPTNGVYYMNMYGLGGDSAAPDLECYQNGVDFTHSASLTFDYSFTYSPVRGFYKNSATVQIILTLHGSVTVWQQTIDSTVSDSSLPIQNLNTTVTLPLISVPGKLSIQAFSSCSSPSRAPYFTFNIDNFRVQ